jgi:SAM-dependent methyltransferase
MNRKEDIRKWWADNPMTYGREHGTTVYKKGKAQEEAVLGTKEFFQRADSELFSWNKPLHDKGVPFAKIFDFSKYRGKSVLEVGCGLGGMSMLWAQSGCRVTATDLNPVAVAQTQKRFELFGLPAAVRQEDANRLSFAAEHFDYAYSWGVLHHSPDLVKSIAELMRVLKKGAGFGLMLYNRGSIAHSYVTEYIEGFLHYEHRFLNPLELASRYGDGARKEGNPHTWPVTKKEALAMLKPFSNDVRIRVLGTELDSIFKLMLPGVGLILPAIFKKTWARHFGWSLWIYGTKD